MNPLKAIMGQNSNDPMNMIMQIMASPNKEETAMNMLRQVNPQAYNMIKGGANPQQLMSQFGITNEQINFIKNQFGNNIK